MARSPVAPGETFTHRWGERWPDLSAVGGFVYLLMQGDAIVYVGMTANIRERWSAHCCRPRGKVFDRAEVIACTSPAAALVLERQLILEHQPSHNVQFTSNYGVPA